MENSFWNPSMPVMAVGVIGYIVLCSLLRFRRIERLRMRHGFVDRASLSRMTNIQAHVICRTMASYEFPLFYDLALRVALFKTYAMENIAKLLMAVSDLGMHKTAPKRYEDTEVIFASFIKFPPDSPELHKAVARMNFLHGGYIKSGKILNKDLLYVLYASMWEPVRFMRLYEWRSLTDMETAALGTLWKYVGEMMEIDYHVELGKKEWSDGIEFVTDVQKWALAYEDEYMKPLPEVKELGHVLMELLLTSHPKFARPLAYQSVLVLLGERMRHAFGLPEPSVAVSSFVYTTLFLRQNFIRYLCLPRIFQMEYLSEPNKQTGRIQHLHYLKEPWYYPVTFWSRWGPDALITRAFGGQVPGDGGGEMKPQGFLFEDIGPKGKVGKGIVETAELEFQVRSRASTGCPFSRG